MKLLGIGILGSGNGSNCRAILESIRSGVLPAEARVVISDVLDAPILDIAREFSVPNAYLPPGEFRTRLERNLCKCCATRASSWSFSLDSCVY